MPSALEFIGAGTLGANAPWPRVATALQMPGASPTELVRRLVLDGDSAVVAVLPTTGINVLSKHSEWTDLANAGPVRVERQRSGHGRGARPPTARP